MNALRTHYFSRVPPRRSSAAPSAGPILTARAIWLARAAYVALILIATLSNLNIDTNSADVHFRLVRAFHIAPELHDVVDGVRNIALFAGLGAIWIATTRARSLIGPIILVTLLGTFLGVLSETAQLFSKIRNSSILDVLTNGGGTLLGALAMAGVMHWLASYRNRKSFVGMPAVGFALSYGVSVAMEAFAPLLRNEKLPNLGGSVAARIGRAIHAMQWSSVFDIPLVDVIIFAPAGIFAVAAMMESGTSPGVAWPIVGIVGAILAAVIEVVHGVTGQPIQLGAILSHSIAIAAGAWLAATYLSRLTRQFPIDRQVRALMIVYCAVIACWSWRPFVPELSMISIREQFTAQHWIPLRALASRVDVFTVTDIVAQFLLYVPLGALLSVWPLETKGPWRALYPAVYFSIALEAGKIVIAERFFDITHILIQLSGAAIGWLLLRRLSFPVRGSIWRTAPQRAPQRVTPRA